MLFIFDIFIQFYYNYKYFPNLIYIKYLLLLKFNRYQMKLLFNSY